MSPRRAALLVLACLAVRTVAAATPLETYGRLPSLEDAALSADGSAVAFVRTTEDQRLIMIYSLTEERVLGGVRVGAEKLRSIEWADDVHLLLTTSVTTVPRGFFGSMAEWFLMQVYDVRTHKMWPLLEHVTGGDGLDIVYGKPMIRRDGADTILYLHGLYRQDRLMSALIRVNLTSGIEKIVKQGMPATDDWLVNAAGEVVAEEDYSEDDRRWTMRLLRDGRLLPAATAIEPIDRAAMLGFDASGDAIVVRRFEKDGVTWKPLSLRDGSWGADIAPNAARTGVLVDPHSQRIFATSYVGDEVRYEFVDPELQEHWDWAVRVFRGDRVEFESASRDHSKVLLRVTGPAFGYAYYVADFNAHVTQRIGLVYEALETMAEVRPVRYPAADGLQIPAYLTLPPGRPAKGLPLIVLPHGGPESRNHMGFDWWAQALASRGYAVLQPNFRGSSLGVEWRDAGFGEWGRKMQSDLSDGVRYLAAQGIIDPRRVGIVGGSYGGYAALAGVTIESGTYRCAVAVAGISDPRAFRRWAIDRGGAPISLRYLDRFLGVTAADDARLDEISPLGHAASVAVPVMLIHGRDDTIVPYEQSADMAKALARAGKPVELVTLDKEDH